ncbi:hypothetical protein [Rhodoferax sp.]|uniref:hypothetical protein n=1 Tax=Rhodoferax sp. TaxID=50421 RepID=UPI0025E5A7A2|nr:hypothetical protein [Rhodoferax sp.]MCM2339702.1 hypothetical protein [Rhodoferax sp.]
MAVRGKTAHYKLSETQHRHWEALARRSAVEGAWDAMQGMTHRLDAALTTVEQRLPADFPMAMAHTVFQGVRRHLEQFNRGHLLACLTSPHPMTLYGQISKGRPANHH